MAIPFKRMGRKDPRKIDGVLKYHPQLMTSKPDEVEKRKKLGIGERDD